MLAATNLCFGYNGRPTLHGVDLTVGRGEMVALAGPNGTGKTTLMRCLLHLLAPTTGQVTIDGQPVQAMSQTERSKLLAWVPQAVQCRFPMTVFDMILLGRRPHITWYPSSTDRDATILAMQRLGVADLAFRNFDSLSGGQRQKVLTARALAQDTPFLLLDEPTSSLDLRHQLEVCELFSRQAHEHHNGILIALHDLNLARRFADRVVLLHDGRVRGAGRPDQVLNPDAIREVYGVESALVRSGQEEWIVPTGAVAV